MKVYVIIDSEKRVLGVYSDIDEAKDICCEYDYHYMEFEVV